MTVPHAPLHKIAATYLSATLSSKSGMTQTRLKMVAFALIGLMAIGCQPAQKESTQNDSVGVPQQNKLEHNTDESAAQSEGTVPSLAAQSQIDKFEAEFVAKRLSLQQSQQAEYEALQAADAFNEDAVSFPSTSTVSTGSNSSIDKSTSKTQRDKVDSRSPIETASNPQGQMSQGANTVEEKASENGTGVQGVSLLDLPLIDIPIQPPEMLTDIEIASRYKVAMQSLYLPTDLPLPTQAVDTLLNIATLTPEVFNEPQLANRLVLKMPALARMLKQYQIWEQIEMQQSAELQALKQAQIEAQEEQAKKFDELVAEFDDTIKGYDEQIAKYEKKLAEFE